MVTYTKVENLKWTDASHTILDCDVWFDHVSGPSPFTANPADEMEHTQDILEKAIAGVFGPIAAYVKPPSVVPELPVTEV